MTEHDEQVALFEWAELQKCTMPELGLLFAIPNGGHRHKATAAKMKAEGVKRGVPDICLPVARDGFFGLYIELKYGKNKTTNEQTGWLLNLVDQGYFAVIATGFEEAKKYIERYLSMPSTMDN
jgi:hypothetical protein